MQWATATKIDECNSNNFNGATTCMTDSVDPDKLYLFETNTPFNQ